MTTVRRVLVGHDGSPGAARALAWCAGLAAQAGCEVVVVSAFEPLAELEHAVPPVDFHELEERRRADLAGAWTAPLDEAGVPVTTRLEEGPPVDVLARVAAEEEVDLVVIGSHGRTGWRERVFGRVATELPRVVGCPVVVVPLPEPA